MRDKILYISGSMPPLRCGIGYYINNLLEHIPDQFDLLTTAGLDGHRKAEATLHTKNWKILSVPSIFRTIRRGGYRLVHIQYPSKGYGRQLGINLLPYFLRLFTRTKLVITLHEYYGSGLLGKTRDFITALPTNNILVSNPYDFKSLPYVLRRKAFIVPIGSNIKRVPGDRDFFESVLKSGGLNPRTRIAMFFGFAHPDKGLELAILAAEKSGLQLLLSCELSDSNPYQHKLTRLIEQARSRGAKIYSTGLLGDSDVSKLLQEADYFLLPQPLPLTAKSGTAIAAAQHGLLIISTAADDPNFNLPYKDTVNSILLNPINEKSLTDTLSRLEDVRADVSLEKELAHLNGYFSWPGISNKHMDLYRGLLK